jgi:8-oxoguanine deaminase
VRTLLRHSHRLYTCNDADEVHADAYVCIEDDKIVALGSGEPVWETADAVYDMRGRIVLPGFVNVHHHFFQSVTRAVPFGQRSTSLDWMFALYPLWAEMEVEDLYWATVLSAVEQLQSGATTSVDHSNLHPVDGLESVEAQVWAAKETGIRYHLVRGAIMGLEAGLDARLRPLIGDRIDRLAGRNDTLIAQLERTLKAYQSRADGTMLDMSIGPGGIGYDRPDLMDAHARLSQEFDCGLHTHYHPRPVERDMSVRVTGQAPIDYLEARDWLGPRTWFAHCTELSDDEIARFAQAGVGVSHSPRTVLRLGYEIPRIGAMRKAGLVVGVGVDGAASNDWGSMLGDLRLAQVLHRSGPDKSDASTWLTPYDLLLMATRNGAALLRRTDIGRLEVGKCADLAAFDMTEPSLSGGSDPLGLLFMSGMNTTAAMTMVAGTVRVLDGQVQGLDLAAVVERTNAIADRLLDRAGARSGLDFRTYPGAGKIPVYR